MRSSRSVQPSGCDQDKEEEDTLDRLDVACFYFRSFHLGSKPIQVNPQICTFSRLITCENSRVNSGSTLNLFRPGVRSDPTPRAWRCCIGKLEPGSAPRTMGLTLLQTRHSRVTHMLTTCTPTFSTPSLGHDAFALPLCSTSLKLPLSMTLGASSHPCCPKQHGVMPPVLSARHGIAT